MLRLSWDKFSDLGCNLTNFVKLMWFCCESESEGLVLKVFCVKYTKFLFDMDILVYDWWS